MRATLAPLVLVAGLAACSEKSQPAAPPAPPPPAPGACASPDTVATLVSVIGQNVGASPLMADAESVRVAKQALSDGTAQVSVEGIRTVSRDDAVSRSVCNAQLRITVGPGVFDRLAANVLFAAAIGAGGWKRDGQTDAALNDVAYTSQLTDDRKQVYVQLEQAGPIVQGAGLLAVAAWVTKRDAQPQVAAPAAEPSDPVCAGLDHVTTAGQQDCQGRHFKAADAKLNAVYKEAMGRLSVERQGVLQAEQRAWLAGRDTGCEAEVTKDGLGGTAAALNVAGCATSKTQIRAEQLAAFK